MIKNNDRFYILFFAAPCFLFIFNSKIEIIGDIYSSFPISILSFGVGLFAMGLHGYASTKTNFYLFLLLITIIFQTSLLCITNLNQNSQFEFIPGLPFGHFSKLILLYLSFAFVYKCLYHKLFSSESFLKVVFYSLLLTTPFYWIKHYDTLLAINSNNLDDGRAYPDWIGGWNSYAMLLSFALVISVLYPIFTRKPVRILCTSVLFVTLLTTQSRGGVIFFLIAYFWDWILNGEKFKLKITHILIFPTLGIFVFFFGDLIFARFVNSFIEVVNPDIELFQSATSGRSLQWLDAYIKFYTENSSYQYLVGYGIGHYAWFNGRANEIEIHNIYMQFIYEYGLFFGALIIISSMLFLLKSCFTRTTNPMHRVSTAFALIIFLSGFVEGIIFSTQTGWFLFAILAYVRFHNKSFNLFLSKEESNESSKYRSHGIQMKSKILALPLTKIN